MFVIRIGMTVEAEFAGATVLTETETASFGSHLVQVEM